MKIPHFRTAEYSLILILLSFFLISGCSDAGDSTYTGVIKAEHNVDVSELTIAVESVITLRLGM